MTLVEFAKENSNVSCLNLILKEKAQREFNHLKLDISNNNKHAVRLRV